MEGMTKWIAPVLGLIGIGVAIVLGSNLSWSALRYADNILAEAGKVAGALLVVAVFLERGLAVINDLLLEEKTTDLETKLLVAASEVPPAKLAVLQAEWELRAHDEKKQALRLGVGFIVAALIAGAGVRTFTGLLDLGALGGAQRTLLNVMDVLLTAGLLAGGSNGLAKIIELFRTRVSAARMRALKVTTTLSGASVLDAYAEARQWRAGLNKPVRTVEPLALDDSSWDWSERCLRCDEGIVLHAPAERMFTSTEDMELADYAKSAAEKLKKDFPTVVFTSGRRTVNEQASAMAGNIVKNRQWIAQTYAASAERDALQAWVDANPKANTAAAISEGLAGIMNGWTDSQRVKLSRHFAGLAFDVRPTSDAKLKAAIRALPHLVKFLENEGGLTIWHAEFSAK